MKNKIKKTIGAVILAAITIVFASFTAGAATTTQTGTLPIDSVDTLRVYTMEHVSEIYADVYATTAVGGSWQYHTNATTGGVRALLAGLAAKTVSISLANTNDNVNCNVSLSSHFGNCSYSPFYGCSDTKLVKGAYGKWKFSDSALKLELKMSEQVAVEIPGNYVYLVFRRNDGVVTNSIKLQQFCEERNVYWFPAALAGKFSELIVGRYDYEQQKWVQDVYGSDGVLVTAENAATATGNFDVAIKGAKMLKDSNIDLVLTNGVDTKAPAYEVEYTSTFSVQISGKVVNLSGVVTEKAAGFLMKKKGDIDYTEVLLTGGTGTITFEPGIYYIIWAFPSFGSNAPDEYQWYWPVDNGGKGY